MRMMSQDDRQYKGSAGILLYKPEQLLPSVMTPSMSSINNKIVFGMFPPINKLDITVDHSKTSISIINHLFWVSNSSSFFLSRDSI